MITLGQTKVVEIVLPPEPAPPPSPWWWAGPALAVGVCLVAAIVVGCRARRYDPAEAAFRKLARVAGLGRSERRALRDLAAQRGIESPVAFLVCPSALEQPAMRALVESASRQLSEPRAHAG